MLISSTIITCLFLVPLIIIGIITSYTDIRYGKIKNIHLLLGFLYVLLLYLFLAFYSYFIIYQPVNLKYLADLAITGFIAFAIGYLLWYFNFWAAGDVKLFSIYSLLIPLEYYSKNYFQYFPSSTLLTDTIFIICFIFFIKMSYEIILSCFRFLRHPSSLASIISNRKNNNLKKTALDTGRLLLIFSFFLVILQFLLMKIKIFLPTAISNHFLLSLLLLFFQIFILRVLAKNKIFSILVIFGGLLCSILYILSNQTFVLLSILRISLIMMLFMGLGMQLINFYIDNHEIKKIKIQDLCPGACLPSQSLFEITNKMKVENSGNNQYQIGSDGLSKSQVKEIQELFKDDTNKELYIYKTFPFAPFMFSAFIFTIIFKSSLLFFFLRFWNLLK